MVVALEEAEFQVVDGIVSLLVVYIHERCNLRELVSHLLHQLQCSLLIALLIVVELEDEHPLSGVRITDHHVAEQTVLLTQVVEGIVVRISIFEYEVADLVAEVIHQPALPDRINLVEGSGDMETDGVLGVALLERCYGIILFLRELSLDLLFVRQVLPFASAADAEVLAHRLLSHLALLDEANHLGFAILMFLLYYLQVDNISWHTERYEDDLFIYACDALTLGCYCLDGDVL
jgi:hypothetical protein